MKSLRRNNSQSLTDIYKRFASATPGLKPAKAYWNWFRANYEMATHTSQIKARPLKLSIDITNVCQLRCPICPTGMELTDRSIGNADLHHFRRLMEEIGDYLFFIDFFNWGEPLLNKELDEFLRLASSRRIYTTVSTNLSMPLDRERVKRIIESGLSDLIVSIDGATNETYETYRRGGNLDLVFHNIRQFVALKKELNRENPQITWRYLVFRFNEHEMEKARILARELGVSRIIFAPPYVDLDRFPDWVPVQPEFNRYPTQRSVAGAQPTVKRRNRCDWHYISAAINPDGKVAPCCAVFNQKNDFASISDEANTYMAAVNNEKYRSVRDRFAGRRREPVDLVCEHCPTPEIMDYSRLINKMIFVSTGVQLIETLKRPLSRKT